MTLLGLKPGEDNAYFTDPLWPEMWYLNRGGDLDMNVEAAWAQGYTGKGVKVQGDHSACSQGCVDIKTKVAF